MNKPTGEHLIDGEFQSDKYPSCPRGKVPLSTKDKTAQDLLWEYAQRRRVIDPEFSRDLENALRFQGYRPPQDPPPMRFVQSLLLKLGIIRTIVLLVKLNLPSGPKHCRFKVLRGDTVSIDDPEGEKIRIVVV
jgi:hypothetical protein